MTHTAKKYVISAFILAAIILLRLGTMKGAADYHYIAPEDRTDVINSALVSDISIPTKKYRENVYITAYSSRAQETDDTPFITASGTRVRDGVVAANWLPIGTKVRIPSLFGDKIFVVEDRMHKRNAEKLDIWFAETSDAYKFGVRRARVEIL